MLRLSLVLFLAGSSVNAATLIVDGDGRLRGATNVDIAGTLYDVDFARVNCTTAFNGCPLGHQFTFNTIEAAVEATTALSQQVFVGEYEDMNRIWGMEGDAALVWTHYEVVSTFPNPQIESVFIENKFPGAPTLLNHSIFFGTQTGVFSIPHMTDEAIAVWSLSDEPAPVPLPASGILLGCALIAFQRTMSWRH